MIEQFEEILESQLEQAGLGFLGADARKALATYCAELDRWNQKLNLTGLSGASLVQRLVVEPVWIGVALKISGVLTDVGSGNGSPGVPIAIARQLGSVQFVEPRIRRAAFIRNVLQRLRIVGGVEQGRLEDVTANLQPANWYTFQGLVPSQSIVKALPQGHITTNVVWITTNDSELSHLPEPTLVTVPFTKTRVKVFSLDQS